MGRARKDAAKPREVLRARWTRDEIRILTTSTGAFAISVLERQLPGRTRQAIRNKLHELFGGGVTRGTQSLTQVAAETGYTPAQILRASRALGQRLQRASTQRTQIMFFDDQVASIVTWLRHDYWCRKAHLYACAVCGRTDTPPRSIGLCQPCFTARERQFRRRGASFSARTLRKLIEALRATYDPTDPTATDWLDAFVESLDRSCVLSAGALDRLFAECDERSLFPCA